jgi:hypothetical protein
MFLKTSYPSICLTARCFASSWTWRRQSSWTAFARSFETFGGGASNDDDDERGGGGGGGGGSEDMTDDAR